MTEPIPKHDEPQTVVQITKTGRRCIILSELHPDLFCRHASSVEVHREFNMLCPAIFVLDATEISRGGVAAEVCSSQNS